MFRKQSIEALRGERYFRWRGGDVSRIEGITDGVLALAMTLLIVSLEVPNDFGAMLASFKQVPAFAVCFVLLVMLWYTHFKFHRRFGLENLYTVFLNGAFLFLVLLYVYPLKFVFTALFDHLFFGGDGFDVDNSQLLMALYSSGYLAIFGLFGLMYAHAYRNRELLELNQVESQVTRGAIRENLIHVAFGAASVALALSSPQWGPPLAGLIYFGIGPAQGIHGWLNGRKVERLAERVTS